MPQGPAGSNTQAYFAARGVSLSDAECRDFVAAAMRLADLGALDFGAPGDGAREGGAGAGRDARRAAAGLEGATVYNVAPSEYMGSQE